MTRRPPAQRHPGATKPAAPRVRGGRIVGGQAPVDTGRLIQWAALLLGLVSLVAFLAVQSQSAEIRYGTEKVERPPSSDQDAVVDDPDPVPLPTVAELRRLRAQSPIVTVPGSVAGFDVAEVEAAITGRTFDHYGEELELGVLTLPPGVTYTQRSDLVEDLEEEGLPIQITGYDVDSVLFGSFRPDLIDLQNILVNHDVTDLVLATIAELTGDEHPVSRVRVPWSEPTEAQLAPVIEALEADGAYFAPGTTIDAVPASAATAFPDTAPYLVVLPRQEHGAPVPDLGTALAARYPDRPVLVMYGYWFDYHGPYAEGQELVSAAFYAATPSDFVEGRYRQSAVLGNYLTRWTEFRYSGMFDRPLPYSPADPVRIAWPLLPWVFLAGVVIFVVIAARRDRLNRPVPVDHRSTRHRLAGLSALAVELSGLVPDSEQATFVRATAALDEARTGIAANLPAEPVSEQLRTAATALGRLATQLDRADYHPDRFLSRWGDV